MNGMSPEANQLINAGREAFRPTESDRARMMAALTGAATLSVGAVIAAGAHRAFSAIFGAAHAARVLAVVLPVAAAGAYMLHESGSSPAVVQAGPPAPQQSVVLPKPAPAVVQSSQPSTVESPSEPSAPAAPERAGPTLAEPSKPGKEIRQEVALLSKAQAALSRGRPQEALEALSEHAQRFPRGVLSEERSATRARTLCALGRTRDAAAELKRIETLNPTSAYLARARESCGF